MEPNPFLKRLMKDKTEDVVHSSTYANAQNEKAIGAASSESFAERRAVDAQRVFVRRYGESQVGRGTVNRMSGLGSEVVEGGAKAGDTASRGCVSGGAMGNVGTTGNIGGNTGNGATRPPMMRRNPGISR